MNKAFLGEGKQISLAEVGFFVEEWAKSSKAGSSQMEKFGGASLDCVQ